MPDCAVCLPNGHVEKSTFCGFLSQNAGGLQEQHQHHHPVELFAAESLAIALHLVNDVVRRHDPAVAVPVSAHHRNARLRQRHPAPDAQVSGEAQYFLQLPRRYPHYGVCAQRAGRDHLAGAGDAGI